MSGNCKKAIHTVNNKKAPRKVSDVLQYEPIYKHVIPHKADDDIKISHPSLRIEERAPRCDVSILERSKAPPSANPPTIPAQAWEEHLTSSSSTYVSPESSDSEEEGEKAVNQLIASC